MWDNTRPIIELPQKIQEFFRDEADFLYKDLLENRLSVVLVPAPEPNFDEHKIWVAENHNPHWYRDLYCEFAHFRRDRSLKSLNRIRTLTDRQFKSSPYKYDSIYRELIQDRLIEGYETQFYEVPFNQEIIDFFEDEELSEFAIPC